VIVVAVVSRFFDIAESVVKMQPQSQLPWRHQNLNRGRGFFFYVVITDDLIATALLEL
jgi:hypothetical protein